MKVIEPGHVYKLNTLDGDIDVTLTFVNREPGKEHPGTQTQEVLRALIDRTRHCDACLPSELNAIIIDGLQRALVAHEMRAMLRKQEKGLYNPELIITGDDGHFNLYERAQEDEEAPIRKFKWPKETTKCKYRTDY